ncbi:bifunctional ADP-dependent NAD(P)H-hydrate dehydratase/NAD(P)H-hydrate epimerase [Numidum massiliense]|uniref:bifunctional ADP-dependent NAD(P)H-hydrate dehydratase/NAD(P)H-hydrate epimerase n=1 Tax=Numidum massiliense TaxID=1522315 RepID=UPI0006D56F75|nr:bifunctional ADP-dependent NAD(P)H-hydrate dehydratase/NAD(P)H-hydrate epimerase [Numidum massiliense]
MYLVNAREMRQLDRQTIEEVGIPSAVLMEVAGRAVADEVKRRARCGSRVTVLAGSGNNGGDGFVAARHLHCAGYHVEVWLIGSEEKMSSEASNFWNVCQNLQLSMQTYRVIDAPRLKEALWQSDVVIDSLLGTGVKGAVREPLNEVIEAINAANVPLVVAVDVPSGVETDTGAVLGAAVRAHCTVTFAFPKWCHYLAPGATLAGECVVADIGIPSSLAAAFPVRAQVSERLLWTEAVKPRTPFSYKGTYGHVLVVGGSRGMAGAPVLTARAVLKAGAGLVTTAVPRDIQDVVAASFAEGMTWGVGRGTADGWHETTAASLCERMSQFQAVAIGPGMPRFSGDTQWLRTLVAQAKAPIVLDAGALSVLAEDLAMLTRCRETVVLTPHPGEMARLLGTSVSDIEQNRPAAARKLSGESGAVVVLKGRYSLTALPDGRLYLNPTGTPALAKGGSGDVLTGVVAALLAQQIDPAVAVPLAVYVHGYAGQLAEADDTPYSVLASDTVEHIGPALREVTSN